MEKELQEALKPFDEKVELIDSFVEEVREKLGEEDATKVNDTLLGLRGEVTNMAELVKQNTEDLLKTKARNDKLVQVNNDFYIQNRDSQKPRKNNQQDLDIDDDNAVDAYVELATNK